MIGQAVHYFLKGRGQNSLFHTPRLESVNDFLEQQTGVPRVQPPGYVGEMIDRAVEEFGRDTPLILAHDERKVCHLDGEKVGKKHGLVLVMVTLGWL